MFAILIYSIVYLNNMYTSDKMTLERSCIDKWSMRLFVFIGDWECNRGQVVSQWFPNGIIVLF